MTDRGAYKRPAVPPPLESLGERIRAWRLWFDCSQESLAVAVGVNQSTIAMWEKDKRTPKGPALNQLLRVLGVSKDALETGQGFEIPAHSLTGYRESVDPEDGGDRVAIEKGTKTPLILPAAHPGQVWGLEIGAGTPEPLTPEKAVEWLQAALDEDKVVWIVTRPSGGLKATRRVQKRNPKT